MAPQPIGAKIRAHRLARGWKQEDLADRVGRSVAAISRIETGETKRFNPELLSLFDEVFELEPGGLLSRDAPPLPATSEDEVGPVEAAG
jgi:transcriptional regulator with XRE-family HTH domain